MKIIIAERWSKGGTLLTMLAVNAPSTTLKGRNGYIGY